MKMHPILELLTRIGIYFCVAIPAVYYLDGITLFGAGFLYCIADDIMGIHLFKTPTGK